MKAVELLELLQYSKGQKLGLKGYEKAFIRERAREEKLSKNEMDILNKILVEDIYSAEYKNAHKIVYNLENGEAITLHNLYKKTNTCMSILHDKIINKVCIRNVPYSYNKNDTPLFYRLRHTDKTFALYRCEELGISLSDKEWRKYFNDPSIKMCYYGRYNRKYKGKYTFKGTNLYIDYIGGKND